jgi:hypothetical protein
MDRKAVGLREIDRHELDAGIHQAGHKMDVAGEEVEFGDDEGGAKRRQVLRASASFGRRVRVPLSTSVN